MLYTLQPFQPPLWAQSIPTPPTHYFPLGQLPTPLHPWTNFPHLPPDTQLFIKRDDLSGHAEGGNKLRKLSFLLADAVQQECDCVITLGGIQSNHARATAVTARHVGLDAHLILRISATLVDRDPGLVGNLLVNRMVGAKIHLVSKEDYAKHGAVKLGEELSRQLRAAGQRPYLIPVGGSSAVGTWGYLCMMDELKQQLDAFASRQDTVIVSACGSGGTLAGMALGNHLSGLGAEVLSYCVCDSPRLFIKHTNQLFDEMRVPLNRAENLCTVEQAKGVGYAISTSDELSFLARVASTTGVLLDPVYTGKAAFALSQSFRTEPEKWRGKRVVFVHTGGMLGLFDKMDQLGAVLAARDEGDRQPARLILSNQ